MSLQSSRCHPSASLQGVGYWSPTKPIGNTAARARNVSPWAQPSTQTGIQTVADQTLRWSPSVDELPDRQHHLPRSTQGTDGLRLQSRHTVVRALGSVASISVRLEQSIDNEMVLLTSPNATAMLHTVHDEQFLGCRHTSLSSDYAIISCLIHLHHGLSSNTGRKHARDR